MKALKSAKVIKVALASASLAAYSWLFSIEFALALIACLMFHEYGHIKAMKYFGMKTKGIYLIPFLGGLALSDEKINTLARCRHFYHGAFLWIGFKHCVYSALLDDRRNDIRWSCCV